MSEFSDRSLTEKRRKSRVPKPPTSHEETSHHHAPWDTLRSAISSSPSSINPATLNPTLILQLQRTAGNHFVQRTLTQITASPTPRLMREDIPRADLGPRANGRAYMLDWDAQHRQIEQDSTLREAFNQNLTAQIERFFGEALTQAQVLERIQEAETGGNTDEVQRLRRLLSHANQFAIVQTLDVEHSERYLPQGERGSSNRRTFCNIYAYDVVTALGGYLPRVWWTEDSLRRIRAGEEVRPVWGRTVSELNANRLTNWMHEFGDDFGWQQAADMNAAQDAANEGKTVILLAGRVNPRHAGHVSVVMPEIRAEDNVRDAQGNVEEQLATRDASGDVTRPMQSQAGGTNEEYGALNAGWVTGATYRDGGAWIFEGQPDSPLLTPEQLGYSESEDSATPPTSESSETGDQSESSTTESVGSEVNESAASQFDMQRAVRLNGRWGTRLGWISRYDDIVVYFQSLGLLEPDMTPGMERFSEAVYDFQRQNESLTDDGIIGPQTWRTVQAGLPTPTEEPPVATTETPETPDTPAQEGVTDWTQLQPRERMAYVMTRLVTEYNLPAEGAAGLVGNLYAESGILPNRIEGSRASSPMTASNFEGQRTEFTPEEVMNRDLSARQGPRRPGIGLAQWTSRNRREGLFEHEYQGQVLGAEIVHNMDAQIDYLVTELQSSYRGVYRSLMSSSVNDASDDVVYNFEIPGSILEDRRKLPRTDPRVQEIFAERRRHSQQALEAYQQAEAVH